MRRANWIRKGIGLAALVTTPIAAPACLSRPVTHEDPTTKSIFSDVIQDRAIDKIDILFMIDNSASMGDKQAYLQAAIPDLITRLVTPNCVDVNNQVLGASHDDGVCDSGQVEFPPIHDLHLGIVSSALGGRGGDVCGDGTYEDDRAELLTRSASGTVADASGGYLAWFPSVTENQGKDAGAGKPITDVTTLQSDFQALVSGVGYGGCGIESQLESWYRFLIQPDPYDSIDTSSGRAEWVKVDATILQQRHDFLRPDSLVAIITLTDENDSEVDVRTQGGSAFQFMNDGFNPPRGTAACATDPNSADCKSCLEVADPSSDPSCAMGPYSDLHDWGMDPNLRHVHMKAKYGIDVQYPLDRYVTGLTSPNVPDRNGEYPSGAGVYVGNNDCTNPLFAAALPDGSNTDAATLCNLPQGTRTKDLIFYAHIGGVPSKLLHFTPNNPAASTLTDADWKSILGNDPEHYDYTGIDPHMIESYEPRAGIAVQGGTFDPVNGYDWITNQGTGHLLNVDREFACIFPLATPRDCKVSANSDACDCPAAPTLTGDQVPPVCSPSDQTQQIYAKAYPTVRELLLAKKVGQQGIVSSICPIDVKDNAAGTDPLYGYRPAVAAIVDRLKNELNVQCLPEKLTPEADGTVPCLVLATLPTIGTQCSDVPGMSVPPESVLTPFQAAAEAKWQAAGGASTGAPEPKTQTVCAVKQLIGPELDSNGSCKASTDAGWCYVTGPGAGTCAQELLFSNGTLPTGTLASLQCIEAATAGTTM